MKVDNDLSEYLDGKRVVLVGPSDYMIGSNNGAWIDTFDIVVRISNTWLIPDKYKVDVGTRMDIIYHPFTPFKAALYGVITAYWYNQGVKFVCSAYPDEKLIADFKRVCVNIPIHIPSEGPRNYYKDNFVKANLSAGLDCIVDLLTFNLKSLHIFGFDFFERGEWVKIINDNIEVVDQNHNIQGHIECMCHIVENDKRVVIDEVLMKRLGLKEC